MSNTKIITNKYGDKVARLTMTLNLDIYLGEEDELPEEITVDYIRDRIEDMERLEFGESVINQMPNIILGNDEL